MTELTQASYSTESRNDLSDSQTTLLSEQLPQLVSQLLDQLWSSVKLRWGILKEGDTPPIILLFGDKTLHSIHCGIDVRSSWRYHSHDRTEDSNVRGEQAHLADFPDVRGSLMVGKDLADIGLDLRAPIHLAPIETDRISVLNEQRGEVMRITLVPAIQQLVIQPSDFSLIRRWRVL